MILELNCEGLQIMLESHYTTGGTLMILDYFISKLFCSNVSQGYINGAPNEIKTHLGKFASLAGLGALMILDLLNEFKRYLSVFTRYSFWKK